MFLAAFGVCRIFWARVSDMQYVLHAGRSDIAPTYLVDVAQAAFAFSPSALPRLLLLEFEQAVYFRFAHVRHVLDECRAL